jgi:hypothetical protein
MFYRAWLQGFWDGEGCVSVTDRGRYHLEVANTDMALVAFCEEALKALDIYYIRRDRPGYKAHYKPVAIITIATRDGVREFARIVGFQSSAKRERLARMVADQSARKPYNNMRGALTPSRELLEQLYVKEGLTLGEIAVRLGYGVGGRDRIAAHLNRHGIPRRDISTVKRLMWQKRRSHQPAAV